MPAAMLNVNWRARHSMLEATAAVATGREAAFLARRCLVQPEVSWFGVIAEDTLLLLGKSLPWCEGIIYLGADSDAPCLLMPVYLEPDKPVSLVEESLRKTLALSTGAFAGLPSASRVIDLRGKQPLEASALSDFAQQESP